MIKSLWCSENGVCMIQCVQLVETQQLFGEMTQRIDLPEKMAAADEERLVA